MSYSNTRRDVIARAKGKIMSSVPIHGKNGAIPPEIAKQLEAAVKSAHDAPVMISPGPCQLHGNCVGILFRSTLGFSAYEAHLSAESALSLGPLLEKLGRERQGKPPFKAMPPCEICGCDLMTAEHDKAKHDEYAQKARAGLAAVNSTEEITKP